MTAVRRITAFIACAIAILAGLAWPANAELPGQPNGIPESANSYQWRFQQGEVCFEDWTNGVFTDAIKNSAVKISNSSDLNIYYRTDCEAAGFGDGVTITFVQNFDRCTSAVGQALVWTMGGFMVEGEVITRGIVHLYPNCPGWWDQGTATEIADRKRMLVNHEALHVFGFLEHTYPLCAPAPENWTCRWDTVMVADAAVNPNPTAWDFYRLDLIHPW